LLTWFPDAYEAIKQCGHNLGVLYFGASLVSEESVSQILHACSALEELEVHGPNLSPECAQEIRMRYPRTGATPGYIKHRRHEWRYDFKF
jgi:hypothetical protein